MTKRKSLETGEEYIVEITRGGPFKDDHAKPLFTNAEFEAAVAYLSLKMDIEDAQSAGLPNVMHNGKELPLAKALIDCEQLRENFAKITETELRSKGTVPTPTQIEERMSHTLASNEDTAYIPPRWCR